MNNTLRVGFVGAGGIAARHLQALQELGKVEVAGVSGSTEEKARAFAAKCGPDTSAYADYRVLLDNQKLDALYITVPPFAHGEIELAAIERDLPFFVEKPLSADPETAETIFQALQSKKLVTAVGYQWRYLDTTETARQLVAQHPVRLALGYWLDALPPPYWWRAEKLSGGQMVEQTTHILDLARLLVDEVKRVYAVGGRFDQSENAPQVDVVSAATLEFASGAVGNFSSTCVLDKLHRKGLDLFCDGLAIELGYQEIAITEGKTARRVEKAQVDPFLLLNRDFLEAVAGGENRIKSDYAEALRTHRLAHAIARSARERRPLDLE